MSQPPQLPEINSFIEGRVVRVKPFGAIVQLPDFGKAQGLVHISHITDRFVQDIDDFVRAGDVVRVKVLAVDKESGKIRLSMKDAPEAEKPEPPQETPEPRPRYQQPRREPVTFEDKFKDWVRSSNERHAGINKRNKRK